MGQRLKRHGAALAAGSAFLFALTARLTAQTTPQGEEAASPDAIIPPADGVPADATPSLTGPVADSVAAPTFATVDNTAPMLAGNTELVTWLVAIPIILPLIGAAVTLAFRKREALQSWTALICLALASLSAVALNAIVAVQGPLVMAMGNWMPPFGIVIAVDALSAILVLVTCLVGLVGISYARGDVGLEGTRFGFYTFYLLLICGVCGAFSTGDIFNLYVWFEVFLISSFGLIVFGGTRIQLDGAVKYGVLNFIATTTFLIAVGALYGMTGTLNMADIRGALAVAETGPVITIGALFVFAFTMKAAAFPLHFWLPASYHTPKVIVAALFAGLLTKVGVYSLMRVMIMLFGEKGEIFLPLVAVLGIITAILGALGALAQNNLLRMAAFLVVSGIGVMLIGFGLGTVEGLSGAIVYAVHSILVMTGLFLVLGLAERLSGSGALSRAGGLYSAHSLAAALFLIMALAAAGLPPFSGFWPKLMLVQASLAIDGWLAIAGAAGVIVSGFLTTVVLGRAWALVFLRNPEGATAAAPVAGGGAPFSSTLVLLAIFVTGLGLFPAILLGPAELGAAALFDPSAYVERVLGME
ncbi:MAG: proton-conducting transporter membrane subunit [Devosia sp.]